MKTSKIIITLSLLLSMASTINGQTQWSCNPYAYEYDMAIYFSLLFNEETEVDMSNYELAAFCKDECRGVGDIQTSTLTDGTTTSFGYIRIYSNRLEGDTICFKVYDKALMEERYVEDTLVFQNQELIGLPSSPKVIIFYDERPVTVTAKSYTRLYGTENPVFEYVAEGFELKGVPEITCVADTNSPVGEYPIIVSRGTVKNKRITFVNGVLTITKALLTVKAGTYTRKQGENNPEFTLSYEGFKNNETEAVLTTKPTATTTATKESEPDEYEVTVSGGEAQNYEFTYTNGKLIVTEADPVTITANSYTRTYGDDNPTFEYTSEGATLVGVPEITCEATATSPVGIYPIVIKKGKVTNYNDTYVNGTLTITKALLTVKVEDVTREQYLENPEFVISYIGWKVADDESVLITKPTATTTATKDSPVGEYAIVVSGGEAQNYEFSYQDGTLTVIEPTGICEISVVRPADVYNLQGNKVRTKATTLKGLPQGIYIVNGRKVLIK